MAVQRGVEGAKLPEPKKRRYAKVTVPDPDPDEPDVRSDVARRIDVPAPPFWGSRVVKGIALARGAPTAHAAVLVIAGEGGT